MKSDRLRTIQLNVCNSEEVEKAVGTIRSGLKDPEKGKGPLRLGGWYVALFWGSRPVLPSICWYPGKKASLCCLNSSSCSVKGSGLN